MEYEIYRLIVNRDSKYTNFIEVRFDVGEAHPTGVSQAASLRFDSIVLLYIAGKAWQLTVGGAACPLN